MPVKTVRKRLIQNESGMGGWLRGNTVVGKTRWRVLGKERVSCAIASVRRRQPDEYVCGRTARLVPQPADVTVVPGSADVLVRSGPPKPDTQPRSSVAIPRSTSSRSTPACPARRTPHESHFSAGWKTSDIWLSLFIEVTSIDDLTTIHAPLPRRAHWLGATATLCHPGAHLSVLHPISRIDLCHAANHFFFCDAKTALEYFEQRLIRERHYIDAAFQRGDSVCASIVLSTA